MHAYMKHFFNIFVQLQSVCDIHAVMSHFTLSINRLNVYLVSETNTICKQQHKQFRGLHTSHTRDACLFYLKRQLLHQPTQFNLQNNNITKSAFPNERLTSCAVSVLLKCNEITFQFSATLLLAMRPLV